MTAFVLKLVIVSVRCLVVEVPLLGGRVVSTVTIGLPMLVPLCRVLCVPARVLWMCLCSLWAVSCLNATTSTRLTAVAFRVTQWAVSVVTAHAPFAFVSVLSRAALAGSGLSRRKVVGVSITFFRSLELELRLGG